MSVENRWRFHGAKLPLGLLFEHLVERKEAFVPRFCDLATLDRLQNGASLFLGMAAFGESAGSDMRQKLAKRQGQILFFKKIEALEIQHCKARGICQKATVGSRG